MGEIAARDSKIRKGLKLWKRLFAGRDCRSARAASFTGIVFVRAFTGVAVAATRADMAFAVSAHKFAVVLVGVQLVFCSCSDKL